MDSLFLSEGSDISLLSNSSCLIEKAKRSFIKQLNRLTPQYYKLNERTGEVYGSDGKKVESKIIISGFSRLLSG